MSGALKLLLAAAVVALGVVVYRRHAAGLPVVVLPNSPERQAELAAEQEREQQELIAAITIDFGGGDVSTGAEAIERFLQSQADAYGQDVANRWIAAGIRTGAVTVRPGEDSASWIAAVEAQAAQIGFGINYDRSSTEPVTTGPVYRDTGTVNDEGVPIVVFNPNGIIRDEAPPPPPDDPSMPIGPLPSVEGTPPPTTTRVPYWKLPRGGAGDIL